MIINNRNNTFNLTYLTREELSEVKTGLELVLGSYYESLSDPNNEDDTMWLTNRITTLTTLVKTMERYL